jgi:hypothetical protein
MGTGAIAAIVLSSLIGVALMWLILTRDGLAVWLNAHEDRISAVLTGVVGVLAIWAVIELATLKR